MNPLWRPTTATTIFSPRYSELTEEERRGWRLPEARPASIDMCVEAEPESN
ncbi:hypothetical protein GCM10011329_00390 [Stakelama pacifica]|nr:hypothetical protein GCM10011329_00390 [Stakelama pacifica]